MRAVTAAPYAVSPGHSPICAITWVNAAGFSHSPLVWESTDTPTGTGATDWYPARAFDLRYSLLLQDQSGYLEVNEVLKLAEVNPKLTNIECPGPLARKLVLQRLVLVHTLEATVGPSKQTHKFAVWNRAYGTPSTLTAPSSTRHPKRYAVPTCPLC